MIKKEVKSEVKSETLKSEIVKAETEDSTDIRAEDYEQKFEVMAMGIVADELPLSQVESFLRYVRDHHSGSAKLFSAFQEGAPAVKSEGEEPQSTQA